MDDLTRFGCLNSDCPDYGKRGAGNLTVPHRYGSGQSRRMLRCRTGKARFSERKGTPLFDARLPPEKVESVLEHVAEGCGVRQTGRLCRVAPNTVARWARNGRMPCQMTLGGHRRFEQSVIEELLRQLRRNT